MPHINRRQPDLGHTKELPKEDWGKDYKVQPGDLAPFKIRKHFNADLKAVFNAPALAPLKFPFQMGLKGAKTLLPKKTKYNTIKLNTAQPGDFSHTLETLETLDSDTRAAQAAKPIVTKNEPSAGDVAQGSSETKLTNLEKTKSTELETLEDSLKREARGHTLTRTETGFPGMVGGKNSIANEKARRVLRSRLRGSLRRDLDEKIHDGIQSTLDSNGNQTMTAKGAQSTTGLDLANKLNIDTKNIDLNTKIPFSQNQSQNQGKATGGLQGGWKGAGQIAGAVGAVANALAMLTGGKDKIQYAANQSPTGGKLGPAATGVTGGQDDLNWWQFGNF